MKPRRINSRNKGANGEREAAKWLQAQFNLEHLPERNLEQVRFKGEGRIQEGHDLVGFEPFSIEVKRQETLNLKAWWIQAKSAAEKSTYCWVPVVMYRQNRGRWKFLISAKNIGLTKGYIQLEAREFVGWAKRVLKVIAERNNESI